MNIGHKKKEQRIKIPSQSEINKDITRNSKTNNNKWINLVVLGSVIFILLVFFFFISTYINNKAYRGVGIMTATLIMRICMDVTTIKKRKFPIDEAMEHYQQQLINYYEKRKFMYSIMNPLFLAAYIYGFTMFLSIFEQELFQEFYTLIIYLSWTAFSGLIVLTGKQLKMELEILKSLIADDAYYISKGVEK